MCLFLSTLRSQKVFIAPCLFLQEIWSLCHAQCPSHPNLDSALEADKDTPFQVLLVSHGSLINALQDYLINRMGAEVTDKENKKFSVVAPFMNISRY